MSALKWFFRSFWHHLNLIYSLPRLLVYWLTLSSLCFVSDWLRGWFFIHHVFRAALFYHLFVLFTSLLNVCLYHCLAVHLYLNDINTEIKVNDLETVTSFKYLGLFKTDEGSKPEILSRIAQATAALARIKPVWNDRRIFLSSKTQLMCSLVTSIFLYACESWYLTAELQRWIQAMEMMRCYCKILCISNKDYVTNEEDCAKIQHAIRPGEDLLTIIKGRKLQWYGHASRS